jgi:hypothetical protein
LVTEDGHAADYDALATAGLLAEAVRVLRAFGFANAHAIVVGGLVPSLLVSNPEAGIEPHVGTQDLDLCLSVALIDGDVGSYERLEKSLRDAKFEMVKENGQRVSWRWRGGVTLPITVEFFCPAGPGREPGRLHRPGGLVGGRLSALALSTGCLIDKDVRDVAVEIVLPAGSGRTRHSIRVAGPAAFLASKADALRKRNKNKDAYDIVWLAEAWPGGQPALAAEIASSPVVHDPEFRAAVSALREDFGSVDSAGSVKYARFVADDRHGIDRAAQKAVGAIGALLDAMDQHG